MTQSHKVGYRGMLVSGVVKAVYAPLRSLLNACHWHAET